MSTLTNDEILKLSYRDLRYECWKANLPPRGDTESLRKRLREWSKNQDPNNKHPRENTAGYNDDNGNDSHTDKDNTPNKRQKKSPEDDLVCPITWELPWEPVMAEDGRVYEKDAIATHIANCSGGVLRSPMTNQGMGGRLVPAPQIKSLIETLVENRTIEGELASSWRVKVQQAKDMEDLLRKGKSGCPVAAYKIANCYLKGIRGFKKNSWLSYVWMEKAHKAGIVGGTAMLGKALCDGDGVGQCLKLGIMYTSLAAAQGSDYACYRMGKMLAYGKYGMPVNKEEGIRWMQKSLSNECTFRNLTSNSRARIQIVLDNLLLEDEESIGGETG